jgi:hypothetical protein
MGPLHEAPRQSKRLVSAADVPRGRGSTCVQGCMVLRWQQTHLLLDPKRDQLPIHVLMIPAPIN